MEKRIVGIKKVSLIIISIGIIAFLSFLFSEIIAMLIVALLLAMIFNPIVDIIEKRGINRTVAVLFVFLLCGGCIFLLMSFLIPKIVNQLNSLSSAITPANLQSMNEQFEKTMTSFLPFFKSLNFTERFTSFLQKLVTGWVNDISSIVYSLVSLIAILVIVPFMTFFLLKDNKRIIRGVINIMPNKYFEVSYWVIRKISIQLGRFVRGWILDAFIVGLMAGIGLFFLGIENSASIGFIAGAGHLIPYFGPVIGGLPAIIISIIQFGNFSMLPSIVLMFVVIYTIDNGFIQPNVFAKSTDMHPLVIILLILIGSTLLGVFGMLLAVPAATVIKTAAKEIYFGYKNYRIIRQ
mgnify:FL=1